MLKNIFLLGLLSLFFLGCSVNKEKESKVWYKGNLHAHSYWSDGEGFPEMIMEWYKTGGYDFSVLSDHNTLAQGDKWITLSGRDYIQKGFDEYLKKYGEQWVDYTIDSAGAVKVKLKTYKEYSPLFQEEGKFLILPSEEVTTNYEGKPIHINAANIQRKITPKKGGSVSEVIQNNVDAILAQGKELGIPILPHINHPNFGYGISADDFIKLRDVHFFEVYNGHPLVHNQGDSTHLSTGEMWDLINTSYYEQNKPLLFGVATDDSHQYYQLGDQYSNPGRGWVMVLADTLSAPSIIGAMEKGDFYASTGVVLRSIDKEDHRLKIEIAPEPGVDYQVQFIGVDALSKETKIIKKVEGTNAKLDLSEAYLFVRARVTSSKTNQNFFDETEFEKAWTQPVLTKEHEGK